MLKITLAALGRIKEKSLQALIDEYEKRLSRYAKVQIIELPDQPVKDNPSLGDIEGVLLREEKDLLKVIGEKSFVVALCIEGKKLSSEELANWLEKSAQRTSEIVFIIGSSHGLSPNIKKRSDLLLSMSDMTFPHNLARLMLLEQLYRGFKINKGESYHK